MSDWLFTKIGEKLACPLVVMFQSGRFRTPVAILDVFDLVAAVREYGQEAFLKELARIDKEAKEMKK
jgi:hypothetical protein